MAYKTKVCSKCGMEKWSSEFAKNISRKDGLQTYCKECHNACCRDYKQNNKEKIQAYNKAYMEGLKGHYLYIIYQGKRVAYVGSCSYLSKRISTHINCYSNIAKHMSRDEWTTIKTLDISDMVNSKEEREYIEHILIQELEPLWNSSSKHKGLDDEQREFDLGVEAVHILDNLEQYFVNYKENYGKIDCFVDDMTDYLWGEYKDDDDDFENESEKIRKLFSLVIDKLDKRYVNYQMSDEEFLDFMDIDNNLIDENNIQDYAEDISVFIEKYVEDDYNEDEWE